MNNFNFYNGFNLWSPIQPASFTDSLSYLQHIEILRGKINEVIENLNNANFYARGLKPGKAIDIVGATQGSGFFNGEDPTIINTVINNSVLTDNKPGWHRIFTTKVITEDLKSGLTFLFQEQPLNHNCENDKLSWGILKINFVYNPTDADVDYNTYNIKIVDFAFEEERNLTDKLDRFMLVRRISPCNAENVMELYYKVPTKEEATECADACGPAGLFTLLNIDNKEIDFNTYIKLENEGLNTTTYDGINGVKTNPVINFDYDDITLIGDTEGYGLMNTRNVKVDPTTTPQLIDSFDTTGDVDMRKVNVLKNHRPYDDVPKTNDIVFNMEVPKLIDNIRVENTGVVEGNGSVVVPEVLGAENNIAITIENTFNEDAIKDKVEQYAPKTDIIPPDGSKVLYLAPVDGDDTMDGLSVDTAMKSMTALLNKNYAKEIVIHLVGEPPVSEGEGTIIVNGANYSKITIIDENNILSGYSLKVNNSNVIISNTSTNSDSGSLSLRNDYNEDIEEVLVEEDTVIDYDPNTQRVHYNTYTFKPRMYSLAKDETEEDIEEITETYYSIRPLTLTQNTIYSLEANNSIIDIQGTFTDIFNCNIENSKIFNNIKNLNMINGSMSNTTINIANTTPTFNSIEFNKCDILGNLNKDLIDPSSYHYNSFKHSILYLQSCVFNYCNLLYLLFGTVGTFKNTSIIKESKCSFGTYTLKNELYFVDCELIYDSNDGSYNDNKVKCYNCIMSTSRPETTYNMMKGTMTKNNCKFVYNLGCIESKSGYYTPVYNFATTEIPGVIRVDGSTITIDSNGIISAKGGSSYKLPIASNTTLGGVKVGENLSIDETGVLSAEITEPYTLPIATTEVLGGVKVDGSTINIDSEGVIRSTYTYTLPIATDSVLGGVKQGSTVQISADGTLNVNPDNIAFDARLIPQNKDDITYYVDPINGIDTNDGLTTSTQLKTIEAALNKHSSQNITIDLANTDFTISPLLDLFGYKKVSLVCGNNTTSNITELTVKNGTLIIQQNNTTIGTLNGENAYITGDLTSLNNLKLINSEYITSKPTTSFILSSLRLEHSTIKSTNTFNITASNPYIINSCIDNMNSLTLTKDSIFTIDGLTGYIQNKLTITGASTSDIVKNCKMLIGDLTATNVSFMNCDFSNTNIKGDNTYNFGIVLNLSNVQIDNSNICGKSWKLSNTSINGCNITGNIGTGSNIDNTNKGVGNNMIFNHCHSGNGSNWILSYCNIIGADSTYFSSATKSVINGTYVS